MAVYSPSMISRMLDALSTMMAKFEVRTTLVLTGDELRTLFIAPEHRAVLQEAMSLAEWRTGFTVASILPDHFLGDMLDAKTSLTIQTGPLLGTFLPGYIKHGPQMDAAGTEAFQKLADWAVEARKVRYAVTVASMALVWLNRECGNAKAMQTMFPAVQTLIANIEIEANRQSLMDAERTKLDKRAARISESKTLGALPALPPDARRAVYQSASMVNVLKMADSAPVNSTPWDGAVVSVTTMSLPHDPVMEALSL